MIDLSNDFAEGVSKIQTWRNRYNFKEYPHKILINIMYRAYTTNMVWDEFESGMMPKFSSFQESVVYVVKRYGTLAVEKVNSNLLNWLQNNPGKWVGNCCYQFMEEVATDAEKSRKNLDMMEKSYLHHLLNDKMVLYFIAMRQAGETEAKAIERLTNFQVEMTAKLDYGSTKRMFAELITERFLENKGIKIM